MKLCKDCKHWRPETWLYISPARSAGGECVNDKLTEYYGSYPEDALVYSYAEGGWFWTGPNFGCVHWEAK